MRVPGALRFDRAIGPVAFVAAASAVWLSQHLLAALLILASGKPLVTDIGFWLLPPRRAALVAGLSPGALALVILAAFVAAAALAALTFRRANRAGRGHLLAAFACVPVVQLPALALAAMLPRAAAPDPERMRRAANVTLGMVAGIALLVVPVLVSAIAFGVYGLTLFVAAPFTIGVVTGWLVNRDDDVPLGRTVRHAMTATAFGTLAIVMFALEGLVCVAMAAPLGAGVAALGAALGRGLARRGRHREARLMSVAILPLMIVLDLALPPAAMVRSRQSIDIAAPPGAVWNAIVSDASVAPPSPLIVAAGIAYPIRSELHGRGVGAERIGHFSTGIARERVTAWVPGRTLAFDVLSRPPIMRELSPYRHVHAPHLADYFATRDTRFDLQPLTDGTTRLTISASHVLRIDPLPYWEPLARIAIRLNVGRVLRDIETKATEASGRWAS